MNHLKALQASHCNILRAAEIALVGNHPICLVVGNSNHEKFGKANVREAEFVLEALQVVFVNSGLFLRCNKRKQINMEVCMPDYPSLLDGREGESIDDINKRIEAAKARPEPTEFSSRQSAMMLLKTAAERLSFTSEDVINAIAVSKSIARLDGSDKIQVEHIAEAVQYLAILDEDYLFI